MTGLKQLETLSPSEITVIGKSLPANNSFVGINVLGKSGDNFRLLIEGNVFQAKLPFNLMQGEFFLAKVIGTDPFTLSLDNFFQQVNLTDGKLAFLLSKLQLSNSPSAIKLLKALINTKKPVIRSRFEKLLDQIEKENLKLDDQQLQFLLQVLDTTENSYDNLSQSFISLFQYSASELSKEIFGCVEDLFSSEIPAGLKNAIDSALILHISEGELPAPAILKEMTALQSGLSAELSNFLKDQNPAGLIKDRTIKLINSFTLYTLIRANSHKAGNYPEFIIIENEDELELFEFRFDQLRSSELSESANFSFKLEMAPEALGKVSVSGYLSGSSLKIEFTSSDILPLEESKGELTENLIKDLKVNPVIGFNSAGSPVRPLRQEGFRSIDASV